MDEACAYAQLQLLHGFCPLVLFRGADSVREFEQICLCTLFREIRAKVTKKLGHEKKKRKKSSKKDGILLISTQNDGKKWRKFVP